MKTKVPALLILFAGLSCLGTSVPAAPPTGGKPPVLSETPPLGYNSYDSYSCHIYEEVAMKEIDAFIEKFAPHGYEYFVVDNGWFSSPKTTQFEGYMVPAEGKAKPEDVSMDEHSLKLLTNEHMLACVKNGVHGRLFEEANGIELWAAPTANTARQGFTEYTFPSGWIAMFNRTDQPQAFRVKGRFTSFLPKGTFDFTDVWGKQSVKGYKKGAPLNLEIAPHGVVFMRYTQVK